MKSRIQLEILRLVATWFLVILAALVSRPLHADDDLDADARAALFGRTKFDAEDVAAITLSCPVCGWMTTSSVEQARQAMASHTCATGVKTDVTFHNVDGTTDFVPNRKTLDPR